MKWISVKDRMPGLGIKVLILNEYKQQFVANCESDVPLILYIECNCEEEGTEALNVTHWMPLPKPPEDEEC